MSERFHPGHSAVPGKGKKVNESTLQPSTVPVAPVPLWLRAAVIYLFLPVIVFLAGWLKLWMAAPVAILVAGSACMIASSPGLRWPAWHQIRAAAIVIAMAFVFAMVNGMSGWLPQSGDQLKHNLLFGDLIEQSWPVRYPDGGISPYLCYGLGYYLIPSLVGKWCGSSWLGLLSFIWGAAGLSLFFLSLRHSFIQRPKSGIILFLLCSGAGACWLVLKSGMLQSIFNPGVDASGIGNLLMDIGLQTSNLDCSTRVFYQPQHAITGWLGGMAIHELLISHKRWSEAAVVLAATIFWSPITAAGLSFIFPAALFYSGFKPNGHSLLHGLTAVTLVTLLVAYFLPHLPISEKGFIWQLAGERSWLAWYVAFVLCFALVPVAAVLWLDAKHPFLGRLKPVTLAMAMVLVLSPLFKLGHFGDMRMQLSGPAFLFISLAMTRGLLLGPAPARLAPYLCLTGVFLAGSFYPLIRPVENLVSNAVTDYGIAALRKRQLRSIRDLKMPDFDVTTQYLGNSNSAMAGWILKER